MALENFEAIARRLVVIGVDLQGNPIPPSDGLWKVSPDEALRGVESHSLAKAASAAPAWGPWRDAILGLALEADRTMYRSRTEAA
jgi:hypothetical protein